MPQTNTKRCYPVRWTPEGYPSPVTDWFHRYVVCTIYEQDNTGGAPPQGSPAVTYHYDYLDGAAWHYNDDDGLIDPADKTWSDYRGYGRVGVTVGVTGEQTYTEPRCFRGMHGDKASHPAAPRPSPSTESTTRTGTAKPRLSTAQADRWFPARSTIRGPRHPPPPEPSTATPSPQGSPESGLRPTTLC